MGQSLGVNPIHIVFSTKNRKHFLSDPKARKKMHAYLKGVCDKLKCDAIQIGGVGDHVHVLCNLNKNVAGAKLLGEIKRASSLWAKEDMVLKDFFWQTGYAYFSVSPKDVDVVSAYIANQEIHHAKVGYKDELRAIFKKYNANYDERYFWD